MPRTSSDLPPPIDESADVSAVARFIGSLDVDHDAWHDGTGYSLDQLNAMNPATREVLAARLPVRGWREVEVLAALDTSTARSSLRAGFDAAGAARLEIGLALLRRLPDVLTAAERTDLVCVAIKEARGGDGLEAALHAAETWHPPEVIEALWAALEHPDGVVVVHVAALLHYLHGLAAAPFDLAQRDVFLRFVSDRALERAAAIDQLRARARSRGIPAGELQP